MAIERTAVKPNLDIPSTAGRVLRNFEGAVTADNSAGGEANRSQYAPKDGKR
jgi:hypothetical protein